MLSDPNGDDMRLLDDSEFTTPAAKLFDNTLSYRTMEPFAVTVGEAIWLPPSADTGA